ncbi:MAG: polysaccharide deacetylase family protein [Planctomycetota bacterium]|jgi:peptidoglycan/xylan/chitin deacetylase (PgdA/CDA1 family)
MACLAEQGFRGSSLSDALKLYRAEGHWPERSVAITFDDGYENNLLEAQPVLARYGFTASIYLISGHIGQAHDWEQPPPDLGRRSILDWAQVRELADSGWEIGAHTRTHPNLRELEAKALEEEITGSKHDIEQKLGCPVETFAYPGGFSSTGAETVVAREFTAGCTTVLRRATCHDMLHSLPRVDMFYLRDPSRIPRLISGRLDAYLGFRRLGRRVRGVIS